jgi:superfamily II DNA or RNA helicase
MYSIDKSNTIISNSSYIIPRKNLTDRDILILKTNLNVAPQDLYGDLDKFPLYTYDSLTDCYTVPLQYGLTNYGFPEINRMSDGKYISFEFNGKMRDYQIDAVHKIIPQLKQFYGGIVNLSCGMGKTVLAIYLAHLMGVKTIVLTHRTELLKQWIDRIQKFTNAKVGIIAKGKYDIHDCQFVLSTLQSLTSKKTIYPPEIFNDFGLSIYDEVHHLGSKVFSQVFKIVKTKYVLGLTATPRRADGLYKVIQWHVGNILFKLLRPPNSRVLVHKINYYSNSILFQEKSKWNPLKKQVGPDVMKMIGNIQKINSRNNLIATTIYEFAKEEGRHIIVLGKRIEQLTTLYTKVFELIQMAVNNENLLENEITLGMYTGRENNKQLILSQSATVIFATYDKAEEGLDIESLNTLVIATPKKDSEQSIGRIMRKENEFVFPTIIDFVDELSIFNIWGINRDRFYSKNKYKINHLYAYNNTIMCKRNYIKHKEGGANVMIDETFNSIYPTMKNYTNINPSWHQIVNTTPDHIKTTFCDNDETFSCDETEIEDIDVIDDEKTKDDDYSKNVINLEDEFGF